MLKAVQYGVMALALALVFTPLVKKLAFRVGAVDQPNKRKVHSRIMPRLGGVAIFLAFLIPTLLAMDVNGKFLGLLLGGTIIVAIGIVDDIKEISPKVKLIAQIVAAFVMIGFGVRVDEITNPFGHGTIHLSLIFSIPLTLFWLVGVTNAVNLVDGLDGLAAGISFIASITLGVAAMVNDPTISLVAFILAGAIFGFMKYNFNPASIFMGDSGSLFLGFTLGSLSIMGLAKSATVLSLFVPILVLGVPILDTLFAILRRYFNEQPIFQADKDHLHHRLMASGLTHKRTVLTIYGIHAMMSASAILLTHLTTTQGMLILLAVTIITLVGANRLGVIGFKRVTTTTPEAKSTNTLGG